MNRKLFVLVIVVLPALVLALAGGAAAEPAAPQVLTEKIVFARSNSNIGDPSDIYIMNPDGSNQVRLTTDAANEGEPVWSPDGTRIAFRREVFYSPQIFVMNADGSGATQLTNEGWNFSPTWSPDGAQIAFQRYGQGIFVMNADGTNVRQLTTGADDSGPDWSPNGDLIAFTRDVDESYYGGNLDIFIMDADGTDLINLTDNPSHDSDPNWSPDGMKIVYVRQLAKYTDEIFVMNADGTGRTRLTFSDNWDWNLTPSWSPDGQQIVYARRPIPWEVKPDIFMMNADGSNQINVTANVDYDYWPDWRPGVPDTGPRAFGATADAFVTESKPAGNSGRKTALQARHTTTTDKISYVKFRVGSLDTVQAATLRLYVTNAAQASAVYATSPFYANSTELWLETELRWNNRPALGGAPLATFAPRRPGKWIEVDVTSAVSEAVSNGDSYVAFAVTNSGNNLVAFSSRNAVRNHPTLVVVTN